jgi:hypothetical protein
MSDTSQIGACVSDLVAEVHGLVTEGETDNSSYRLLSHRVQSIRATANAIIMLAERIAEERRKLPIESR